VVYLPISVEKDTRRNSACTAPKGKEKKRAIREKTNSEKKGSFPEKKGGAKDLGKSRR